ncbi:PAS domain S-box protein [Massilia sp. H6]|uniref:PAS domain-containing hybrid sensor histidine kinase/response regulator n=1 Tax=Massilia sp. H6 TaxID=2970464 RepID=UPI002169D0AF|nr:PAS domain S-box protein [Massilia sp. H6]UVW27835.1 PAS domain S-box protein [Massilia sp. H6]
MASDDTYYPHSFKAAVALAALRDGQSMQELGARFSVSPELVAQWSDTLERHADLAFSQGSNLPGQGEDLFDSSEIAKTIAENSTQGFAMMDRHGFCIYANKTWLAMTGYSAEEIGSKPLHYLVHHHHPDGRPYPMEECPIDRALPENFAVRAHEDVFFRKDGSTFEVACAASPIFQDGRPVATVIEIRDVTEQKQQARERIDNERRAVQLADAAEERRRQLDALLDAAPVGIGMADVHGKLILVNRANRELWGQSMAAVNETAQYREFQGWWADGAEHHGQRLQAGDWGLARALQGESVDNDIVEIAPFDQPDLRKTIALSARPIHDELGVIRGGVVAQVDITLQKQAEQALRRADKNKEDFIAVLAHELRNPLAPIRAAVDLFKLFDPGNPVLRRATEAMGRQVTHITRLVDDLLDVARISRGRIELRRSACDLAQVVALTAEDYRQSIQDKGVSLHIEVAPVPVWVDGDSARLAQIVGNLLHNAAKFSSKGGRVTVSVHQEAVAAGVQAVVTVADDGIGLAPELIDSLFEPFVQAVQDLGRGAGGLGLGLALVKGLTQLHGGVVSAHSMGIGFGAAFTVRLPSMAPVASGDIDERKPVHLDHLKIVAIDDNQDALEMLGLLLGASGHDVSTACDGASGLALVGRIRPDVVVCDIGLPGSMSGYDVVRAIRSDPAIAHTVCIALSGYGQESDRRESAAAGFDEHLVKPVSHADLEDALKQALLNKRSRC